MPATIRAISPNTKIKVLVDVPQAILVVTRVMNGSMGHFNAGHAVSEAVALFLEDPPGGLPYQSRLAALADNCITIQVELTEGQIKAVQHLARKRKVRSSAIVNEALITHLVRQTSRGIDGGLYQLITAYADQHRRLMFLPRKS